MKKYLAVPEKQPAYRENRAHGAFLAPLSRWIADRNALRDRLPRALRARGLVVREASLADAEAAALEAEAGKPNESVRTQNRSIRKSTAVVDLERALTMDADARAPTLPRRH